MCVFVCLYVCVLSPHLDCQLIKDEISALSFCVLSQLFLEYHIYVNFEYMLNKNREIVLLVILRYAQFYKLS